MTFIKHITAVAVAVALIATPSLANDKAPSIKVDESFFDWGINFGSGASYRAKMKLLEVNGRLALCGAGYIRGDLLKTFADQALAATYLTLNDKAILENFRYFKFNNTKKQLAKSKAKCRYTTAKLPIPKSADLDIKQYKTRFTD